MNVLQYTHLLNKPEAINQNQIIALEKVLTDFPYLQSAHCLHLKGLYKQESFKYNQALKLTAAYTQERNVLFDFVTNDNFIGIQKHLLDENEQKLKNVEVVDVFEFNADKNSENKINTLQKSILDSILISNPIQETKQTEYEVNQQEITQNTSLEVLEIERVLSIGKPIQFNKNETHSFQEWLKLSKLNPIIREENTENNPELLKNLTSKLEIIDKFIELNPKISAVDKNAEPLSISIKKEDTSYLMTETLAKVYLEQKKYNKAIQAYEILILKYPEKSSLFANRISEIKKLQ